MYVIFPADEVVYLSYGRLIYVPSHPYPDGELRNPIRTNSLYDTSPERECNVANISAKKKQSLGSEPYEVHQPVPGTSRQIDPPVLDRLPSSGAGLSAAAAEQKKPKKKLLKLNFNLLKKNSHKTPENAFSPRLRKSIGHIEKLNLTSRPEEAFRKFCITNPKTHQETSLTNSALSPVKENVGENSTRDKFPNSESKRSSSSSKTGKPPSGLQDDKDSKRSSKHSTSSSKSGKTEKNSPNTPNLSKKHFKKAQSLVESEVTKESKSRKISTGSVPTNEEQFYPLRTNRRGVVNLEVIGNNSRSRRISTNSNPANDEQFYPLSTSRRSIANSDNKEGSASSSSPFKFNLRRRSKSKTPEPKPLRSESDSQGFYPLSTSREKTLEEQSVRESPRKSRRSPFRLSFRRSKTPEVVGANVPARPERKKDKKERQSVSPKSKTLERKLSFSDYLSVSENRPQTLVLPPSGREKSKSKSPVLGLPTKSPVFSFFRKTPPSPRPLGRDRTPGILHTPHTPFFPPNPPNHPDYSQYNSVHNSLDNSKISANASRSKAPTPTAGE